MKQKLSPAAFRAKLVEAELSQAAFAAHIGRDRKTVNRWSMGRNAIPYSIALTIDQLIRQCKFALMGKK